MHLKSIKVHLFIFLDMILKLLSSKVFSLKLVLCLSFQKQPIFQSLKYNIYKIQAKLCSKVGVNCTLSMNWDTTGASLLSMEFSRQEYWSGQLFPSPASLPNPRIKPRSPALQADSLPAELQGKSHSGAYILMEMQNYTILHSHQKYTMVLISPCSHQHLLFSGFFIVAIPKGIKQYFIVGFFLIKII